ncbi:MAG: PDZ domain-containing protein [Pseudomonadota bacterium]
MRYSQLIFILLTVVFPWTIFSATPLQQQMLSTVDQIGQIFNTLYAPAGWKKQFAGWDLNNVVTQAKDKILKNETITVKDFHKILAEIFYSTRDYHVGFSFVRTERATLPLTIRGVGERYFIAYIDRDKLSLGSFPFAIGDELITFGGKPIQEEINFLRKQTYVVNTEPTDQALAELALTNRRSMRGLDVPHWPEMSLAD